MQSTTRGTQEQLALWYEQAAGAWVEALPVGNGRIGAMCFGRIAQERLQLIKDTPFAGGPYTPNNPAALSALPQVRAQTASGHFEDAAKLIERSMMGIPKTQMPYGAAGDLLLNFTGLGGATAYRRWLDLDSAICSTRFRDGKVQYKREVFASVPDQVIVMRLSATGGMMNFDIAYRHPSDAKYGLTDYSGGKQENPGTAVPWDYRESSQSEKRPTSLSIRADGERALLVEGSNIAVAGIPAALRYAVRIRADGDGTIVARGDGIEVRGASNVTLIISAKTSYIKYDDVSGSPVEIARKHGEAAARKSYARLRSDHVATHQPLFRRLSLRIGPAVADARPTDQRIAKAEQHANPTLAALYVQYGRYLLLSSSRFGSQPANL